jgi:hypothetical protein
MGDPLHILIPINPGMAVGVPTFQAENTKNLK